MGAAQFKEHCLQVLDELPAEGVVITKRGKPVARQFTELDADVRCRQRRSASPGGAHGSGRFALPVRAIAVLLALRRRAQLEEQWQHAIASPGPQRRARHLW